MASESEKAAGRYYALALIAQQDIAYANTAQALLDLMMARQTSFYPRLPAMDKEFVTKMVVNLKEKIDA